MLKRRMSDEGAAETYTNCVQLKMRSPDGKQRQTDAADVETLLRIIQSIPSPKAEPVKRWLAKIGAQRLDAVTQPAAPTSLASEKRALTQPDEMAPALEWAEYYERLAALYRRQAAYEARLRVVDAMLVQHEADINELHARMESADEVLRLVPEILERLGPETLTPEHQRTLQNAVKRLHEVGGYTFATIYTELGEHFHVAKYDQIADARWEEVAEWFRVRIAAAEKRHGT